MIIFLYLLLLIIPTCWVIVACSLAVRLAVRLVVVSVVDKSDDIDCVVVAMVLIIVFLFVVVALERSNNNNNKDVSNELNCGDNKSHGQSNGKRASDNHPASGDD